MCKFITIVKSGTYSKQSDRLLTHNLYQLASERDGYSTLSVSNKIEVSRGLEYENIPISTGKSKLFTIHTRTATTGDVSEHNTHLQLIHKRYYFAHNGTVSRYMLDRSGKTDSMLFFEDYLQSGKIDSKSLSKFINEAGFMGRGFIYDTKLDTSYIFSNNNLYVYAIQGALVFSTYDVDLSDSYTKSETVQGFKFTKSVELEKIKAKASSIISNKLIVIKGSKVTRVEKLTERKASYSVANYVPMMGQGAWYDSY